LGRWLLITAVGRASGVRRPPVARRPYGVQRVRWSVAQTGDSIRPSSPARRLTLEVMEDLTGSTETINYSMRNFHPAGSSNVPLPGTTVLKSDEPASRQPGSAGDGQGMSPAGSYVKTTTGAGDVIKAPTHSPPQRTANASSYCLDKTPAMSEDRGRMSEQACTPPISQPLIRSSVSRSGSSACAADQS